jgi:hypothetical protein
LQIIPPPAPKLHHIKAIPSPLPNLESSAEAKPKMRNRPVTLIAIALTLFIFFSYVLLPSRDSSSPYSQKPPTQSQPKPEAKYHPSKDAIQKSSAPATSAVSQSLLHGEAIMPHLGNETIKAELGRASWKLLHTTLARFPEKPTPDEREALNSYLHLFARLYPWYPLLPYTPPPSRN